VTEWVAMYWNGATDYLRGDDAAAKLYLRQDHAPKRATFSRIRTWLGRCSKLQHMDATPSTKEKSRKKYWRRSSATVA